MNRRGDQRGAFRAAAAIAAAVIAAGGLTPAGAAHAAVPAGQSHPHTLTAAFTPLPFPKSTVLTLEGGIVGIQPWLQFTPRQLRGDLCKSPSVCKPVTYFAFPGGPQFNADGARKLMNAVSSAPTTEPVVLFGHSQGGQVIYSALRSWEAQLASAPDPSRVSWVSIGNPENRYGGSSVKPGGMYANTVTLPVNTPYKGIEVIRQYDGWADYPDDPNNFLAVLNAMAGQVFTHTDYWNVNLNDPRNVTFTPDKTDGTTGNVTYMWIPTDIMPLVSWAGPFAPMLDKMLRPQVEKGYSRPVQLPDPHNVPKAPAAAVADPELPAAAPPDARTDTVSAPAATPSPPVERLLPMQKAEMVIDAGTAGRKRAETSTGDDVQRSKNPKRVNSAPDSSDRVPRDGTRSRR